MAQNRRLEIKFEAHTQKENESLEDYVDYNDNYCTALAIDDDEKVNIFFAYLNSKSRRRARLMRDLITNWDDVATILLKRGSTEEKKTSRRKLENRKWESGEEFMDYAA